MILVIVLTCFSRKEISILANIKTFFIENTKENRTVQQTVATMAISGMYFDRPFIKEMIKVSNGEKTSEDVRQEVLAKYRQ